MADGDTDRVVGPGPLFEVDADGDMVYAGTTDSEEMRRTALNQHALDQVELEIKRNEEVREKYLSGPGALGLPRLLEKRRLAAGIPDQFFTVQADYDRILVYQIPTREYHRIGSIQMSDTSKQLLKESAPRGVIISAGLGAMDSMHSAGAELGDIIVLQKSTPYRFPVMFIAGVPQYCIIMTVGEVCANEDLACRLWSEKLVLMRGANGKHFYRRKECEKGHGEMKYGHCSICGASEKEISNG